MNHILNANPITGSILANKDRVFLSLGLQEKVGVRSWGMKILKIKELKPLSRGNYKNEKSEKHQKKKNKIF